VNSIEKIINAKMNSLPFVKKILLFLYQGFFSVFSSKKVRTKYDVHVMEGYFYGFHDKCPFSPDNTKLLAHKIDISLSYSNINNAISFGYFDMSDYSFKEIGKTKSWNLQMGSMLQWVGNSNEIIYNDYINNKHIALIKNIDGTILQHFSNPIAAVDSTGKYALSHSFTRLRYPAPAYSYVDGRNDSDDVRIPKKEGISLIDIRSGEIRLILEIEDIAMQFNLVDDSFHYVTHCLFNPTGSRFVFYYRRYNSVGAIYTDLFTSDLSGANINHFEFAGAVTHVTWLGNTNLLVYGNKKVLGEHYYLLEDMSDNYEIVGESFFKSDGHPQTQPHRQAFITDTYPDRYRRQRLLYYDVENNKGQELFSSYAPLKFRDEKRCDFHPRWDRFGHKICFDSAHTNIRSICILDYANGK